MMSAMADPLPDPPPRPPGLPVGAWTAGLSLLVLVFLALMLRG